MTAVDFSSVALERGRQMSDEVRFITADVFSWVPEGDASDPASSVASGFDLILIAYLQVEAEPLQELISRVIDWLEPGGELFMIGHDISNIDEGVGGPQVPEILWDLDAMLEWLGDLRVIEGGIVRRPVERDGDIVHARDTLIRARAPATAS
jgi:hypothetical protein